MTIHLIEPVVDDVLACIKQYFKAELDLIDSENPDSIDPPYIDEDNNMAIYEVSATTLETFPFLEVVGDDLTFVEDFVNEDKRVDFEAGIRVNVHVRDDSGTGADIVRYLYRYIEALTRILFVKHAGLDTDGSTRKVFTTSPNGPILYSAKPSEQGQGILVRSATLPCLIRKLEFI